MTVVFLDSVGLIAVWDEADQWHAVASLAYSKLVGEGALCVTSTFILAECGNAAARKPYRHFVDDLRVKLEEQSQLFTPSEEDWQMAWREYRQRTVGNAGIVDHVSFRVMRRLGIGKAFTNDRHFEAAGFEILF